MTLAVSAFATHTQSPSAHRALMTQWIQVQNKTWHAWPMGGRRTCCGRVNVEHLRAQPARAIRPAVPEGHRVVVCKACEHSTADVMPRSPGASTVVLQWERYLWRCLERTRARVPHAVLRTLAERLAEAGTPLDPAACELYVEVQALMLRPVRMRPRGSTKTITTIPHLQAAVNLLPVNEQALARIAHAIRCWRQVTQREVNSDERYHTDRVITTMLQIPDPALYIQHLHDRGLQNIAVIFHPNTLARARKDTALRGIFAGSHAYWERTSSQLNVLRD